MSRQQGVPARDLSDDDLERQGIQAHATRHWVFLHGTDEQFATHTQRMLELEAEYLRRHPRRTWQGSRNAATVVSREERIKDLVTTFTLAMNALLEEPATDAGQDAAAGRPADPVAEILEGFAAAEGGRMHKLEAHQLTRALAPDSHVVAGLYRQDPPLLRAEGDLRAITPAGRGWLAQRRRTQG